MAHSTSPRQQFSRLGASWITVAIFLSGGAALIKSASLLLAGLYFLWLLGVILWSSFGVVHEAEELAERMGEPYGTLVLTLSIVVIEVALISAVMLGAQQVPTLGRDTMFAVLMIVLNGVVGLGLLVGGLRYHAQSYNLQGASGYLAVIIPLAVIALVLPNATTTTPAGTLSLVQSAFFSLFTLLLYGLFLWLQTGRHRGFFTATDESGGVALPGAQLHAAQVEAEAAEGHAHGPRHPTWVVVLLLFANILPVVILAKSLAKLLDLGIATLGAPTALGGIIIAMIVFTPEGISALRAVAANQLTRAINLCLGAAASTLGLTVPAVLMIGVLSHRDVVLGLSAANTVLLATTLVLSNLTFTGTRTTMLEGSVHLTLFFVFLVLVFSP